jgi:hypothetical protein
MPDANSASAFRAEEEAAAEARSSDPQPAPPEAPASSDQIPVWAVAGLSALGGALLGSGLALLFHGRRRAGRDSARAASGTAGPLGDGKDLEAAWSELKWMESAVRSLEAGQQALKPDIERMMERFFRQVEAVIDERAGSSHNSSMALFDGIQAELGELRGRLLQLEDRLDAMRVEGASRLAQALTLLTGRSLGRGDSSAPTPGPVLTVQLQRAMQEFVKESLPSDEEVRRRIEKVARLNEAVEAFRRMAESMGAASDGRLRHVVEDCQSLAAELETLGRSAGTRTLTVRFALDLPLEGDLSAAIAQGTASSIQQEVQRLNDSGRYFDLRWQRLSARAAADCADFADGRLDPQRQFPEVQQALQRIFEAAGITEIAPSRNDDFRAVEHTMVRVTRRTNPADRSNAVAELLARGFRQGSRVVRKASVILFD